jgi:hypothetical protein
MTMHELPAREGAVVRFSIPFYEKSLVAIGLLSWLCLLAYGARTLARYSTEPGAEQSAPPTWPTASTLRPVAGLNTVVMFVHPKCPCSRASLAELEIVMNDTRSHAAAFIVFLRPADVEVGWEQTDTWETAGRIPRTTRMVDREGQEAKRFGARTSGLTLVYDARGRLEFGGGITESRGHVGDSVARQALLAMLENAPTDLHDHAVFGCPLEDPAAPVIGPP